MTVDADGWDSARFLPEEAKKEIKDGRKKGIGWRKRVKEQIVNEGEKRNSKSVEETKSKVQLNPAIYNGPASNRNPSITEAIIKSLA